MKASPQPMSNVTRQKLAWKAKRMSFAWAKCSLGEGSKLTRKEWYRIIYRILAQDPESALVNE